MKISLLKEYCLSKDENLRIVVESIKNRFELAMSYYQEQVEKHPELEGLICE